MSLAVILQGGPWHGEAFTVNKEVPYIRMPEPFEAAAYTIEEDAEPACQTLHMYEYKLHRLTANGARIYRHESYIDDLALEISRTTVLKLEDAKRVLHSYDSDERAFWWAYHNFFMKGLGWPPSAIAIRAVDDTAKE